MKRQVVQVLSGKGNTSNLTTNDLFILVDETDKEVFVTGGTYSNGTTTFTNTTGGTFSVSGFTTPFTGGTVSGATNFIGGLTASTISATTYLNLPSATTDPTHIKIGSVSGRFTAKSYNSGNIGEIYIGNDAYGWSYGDYDTLPSNFDVFGNLVGMNYLYSNVGIPLPTDILSGDKIKICGLCFRDKVPIVEPVINETFYVTVSYFTCDNFLTTEKTISFNTLIPVTSFPFNDLARICFSTERIIPFTLPGCTTYLVVGMTVGRDSDVGLTNFPYKFTYTIDSTQTTSPGLNLFIRNCCDPAYTEIIQNNYVPVGESFVDTDGNCWTVDSETTSDITGIRVLSDSYTDCVLCIAANPCPENFVVQACCYVGTPEIFTAALTGVTVGDTFVDNYGFCWSIKETTPQPITNVVTIATAYPATSCDSAECTDANTCPDILLITSCCKGLEYGYTTTDLLGLPVVVGDTFVDTFGLCWFVEKNNQSHFPDLNFITGATIYSSGGEQCENCVADNTCKITLYYTVQNCCTEEIEVIDLPTSYPIFSTLGIVHDTGIGCYKVLSWSDVGVPTLTNGIVVSVTSTGNDEEGCKICLETIKLTCLDQFRCCTSYVSEKGSSTVTGYLCDGTWVVNQIVPEKNFICMSYLYQSTGNLFRTDNCCSFTVYNPSPTETITITGRSCSGGKVGGTINPLSTSECINCLSSSSGPWIWSECL